MFLKRIKNKLIRTFFREQWSLLVCDPQSGGILKHIVPPPDISWADPFIIEDNDRIYIFVEQQIGHANGTLGYIELHEDLTHSDYKPSLEKEYHRSFPNIFLVESKGQKTWYMIPETHEHRTIDLYRAEAFPDKWVYETTLLEKMNASDNALFFHHGCWWLFTSIGDKLVDKDSNLSLFYSSDLLSGKWLPHPSNPVCTDSSRSRMAGAVFVDPASGKLCRPAQNCLKDYGQSVTVNEIDELSPKIYREHVIKTILPEKNLHAVCSHTLNYSERYMIRDIKTRFFKFA
jgi:hypothetical protein